MGNLQIKIITFTSFLITFLLFTTVIKGDSRTEDMKKMMKNIASECAQNTSASADDVENMIENKPSKTKEGKCLIACLMVQFETLDEAGQFIENGFEKIIALVAQEEKDKGKQEKMREIYKLCIKNSQDETDICEKAEKYHLCMAQEAEKNGLME